MREGATGRCPGESVRVLPGWTEQGKTRRGKGRG